MSLHFPEVPEFTWEQDARLMAEARKDIENSLEGMMNQAVMLELPKLAIQAANTLGEFRWLIKAYRDTKDTPCSQ